MRASLVIASLGSFLFASATSAGVTYTYDTLGRLSVAAYDNNEQITYTYDAAGNRTQVVTSTPPHGAVASKPTTKSKTRRKH